MERTLRERITLSIWLLLRRRQPLAATVLCLLSVTAIFMQLRAPTVAPAPVTLPGMPLGLAVDSATHDAILTTVADDAVLTIDGSSATLLGDVVFRDGNGTAVAVDPVAGYVYVASMLQRIVVLASPINTRLATIDLDQQDQQPAALAINPTTGRVYVATRYVGRGAWYGHDVLQ